MCLITISYQTNPQYPFILIANRDEFYPRPSAAMGYWHDHPQLLAGRDLEQKGTWLGITQAGRFAALTNYRNGPKTLQTFPFSRGHLVTQALIKANLVDTQENYAPFNLFYADKQGLYYRNNHQDTDAEQTLTPGTYGLCNGALDTPWPKLVTAKEELTKIALQSVIAMDDLKSLMTDTTTAPDNELPDTGIPIQWESALSSQFIKFKEEYGTRAKTIILQDQRGKTQICEMRYDSSGFLGESHFEIQIPVFGKG